MSVVELKIAAIIYCCVVISVQVVTKVLVGTKVEKHYLGSYVMDSVVSTFLVAVSLLTSFFYIWSLFFTAFAVIFLANDFGWFKPNKFGKRQLMLLRSSVVFVIAAMLVFNIALPLKQKNVLDSVWQKTEMEEVMKVGSYVENKKVYVVFDTPSAISTKVLINEETESLLGLEKGDSIRFARVITQTRYEIKKNY